MEALAALGLASNLIQFIDFETKLCTRIDYLTSKAGAATGNIRSIQEILYLTLETLKAFDREDLEVVGYQQKTIALCLMHINEINTILAEFAIAGNQDGSSKWQKGAKKLERSWKALDFLRFSERFEDLRKSLDTLLTLVNMQAQSRDHKEILLRLEAFRVQSESKQRSMEETLKPVILVPFTRNPGFIGRAHILEEIDERFSSGQASVALCGLGGVGKSQIALEYSYRFREFHPQASVFWVYTSAGVNFQQAYDRIATHCGIPGLEKSEANILQMITDWLQYNYPHQWLMVIDNVDSAEAFLKDKFCGKPLIEYVLQSAKGSLLFTSRNRDIGVDLTLNRDPIMVPSMSLEEAQLLLIRKPMDRSDGQERDELLKELDCLPLAINQAVAYMAKRRKSIHEYLQTFRQSDSAKVRLLMHEFSDHGRETRRMESLATTFLISFECLKAEFPKAAEILAMMSYLDRQDIYANLLRDRTSDLLEFEDSMGIPEAFSFVSTTRQAWTDSIRDDLKVKIYSVHRLVQLVTRAWLVGNEVHHGEEFATRAMQLLALLTPIRLSEMPVVMPGFDSPGYKEHRQALLAIQFHQPSNATKLIQATLHTGAAQNLYRSDIDSAKAHALRSLDLRVDLLGRDHLETCRSMFWVAHCQWDFERSCRRMETFRIAERWNEKDDEIVKLFRHALAGFYAQITAAPDETMACVVALVAFYLFRVDADFEEADSIIDEISSHIHDLPDAGKAKSCDVFVSFVNYFRFLKAPISDILEFLEKCLDHLEQNHGQCWLQSTKHDANNNRPPRKEFP